MPAILLTAPAAEPLTLAEAKAFLRLEHAAEDALVERLIVSAREAVEAATRLRLVAQRWRLETAVPFNGGSIALKPRPVREVEIVRARRPGGALDDLAEQDWRFDWIGERLVLLRPPTAGRTLEIDLGVGYGPPEDVPQSLKLAMLRLVADGFERRSGADGPPPDIACLIGAYRDVRL